MNGKRYPGGFSGDFERSYGWTLEKVKISGRLDWGTVLSIHRDKPEMREWKIKRW